MRFLPVLVVFALLAVSPGAFAEDKGAQENVIRVIRDDGTVVVIEMGPDGGSTATVEGGPQPPERPADETSFAPAKDVSVPAEEAKPKGQAYPRRKKPDVPQTPKPAKVVPPQPVAPREIPQGTEITKDLALQIALDNAPPSSRFNVYRTALEGQQVFLVLFQTLDGPYEVVVDAMSGEVISRQPVRVEVLETKPGHLPPVAKTPVSTEGE